MEKDKINSVVTTSEDKPEVVDVLLISMIPIVKGGAIWKQIKRCFPSIGIISLAAYAREKGYNPLVIDGSLENYGSNEVILLLRDMCSRYDIRYFGFSSITHAYYETQKVIKFCKENYPNIKIIIGGAHVSSLPDDVLKETQADIAVIGEGELQLIEIIEEKNIHEIDGIAFFENDKIIHTKSRKRIRNLDDLPIPAYDLISIKKSRPFIGQFVGLRKPVPSTLIFATRGCIGNCTFCCKSFSPGVAYKSGRKIIEEIEYLKNNYGFEHFVFYDDTFTSNVKLVTEFCDLLISAGNPITWTCSSRVDCISLELLLKMKNAGCTQIMYGVESFDDNILKNIRKRTTSKQNKNAIIWTKQAGIIVRVAMMVGNPGDTKEILNNNIRVLNKLQPDLIQVAITTPAPGSPLFKEKFEENKLLTFDWSKYNGLDTVFAHSNLSEKELKRLYTKTYFRFYFNPRFILHKIFSINTYLQIRVIIAGLVSFIPVFFTRRK